MKNPLINIEEIKNAALNFPSFKAEHYIPAIQHHIQTAKDKIDQIKSSSKDPSFENTIVALENCSEDLDLTAHVFYNLLNAHTNSDLEGLAKDIGPMISNFSSDITLDGELFERVKKVWDNTDKTILNTEENMLLKNTYEDFVRNGALLDEVGKDRLREINAELSKLGPEFNENVLKATNAFQLVIEDKEDLSGLPESAIEAAAMTAKDKDKEGQWIFNLQAPSLMPFLQYSDARPLREKMWRAYGSRCFNDEFDNSKIVLKIVSLRFERAKLLGFNSHAEFVLQKRMAETPKTVEDFLNKLQTTYKKAAESDFNEVSEFARSLGFKGQLKPWDWAYYSEKLKKQKFDLDEEELRPYFKLENAIEGVFEHATRLFGITFKLIKDYPKYHEDVDVYEVYRQGSDEYVGLFYTDFFPRESKKGGAWMTNYKDQGLYKGEIHRPHVGIVCNFSKPTPTKPSLLNLMEVSTLFHEFGHSLHGLLTKCKYRSLSGTNVHWDFVELPSQMMENWLYEKESLDIFAKHYKTGESIPEDMTKKIKASSQFLAGYAGLRQVNFGVLDICWHKGDPINISDVKKFEDESTADSSLFGHQEGINFSCAFSHIFGGGYSAGYYSYKWAEVLDADAYEYFKEKGLFSKEVANKFKENVLEKGGTEPPMDLYKRFRGREPDPNALFRRDGLI